MAQKFIDASESDLKSANFGDSDIFIDMADEYINQFFEERFNFGFGESGNSFFAFLIPTRMVSPYWASRLIMECLFGLTKGISM